MDFVDSTTGWAVYRLVWLAFASLASVWLLQGLYKGYRHRRRFSKLRGPPHSALWGHLKAVGEIAAALPPNNHPQAYYTELARKYNLEGIFYLDLWPIAPSSVVLADPKLLDEVTVLKPLDQHTMAADFLEPIVGKNIIATANGPVWKRLHHSMLPAFSWSHIRSLTGVFVDECMTFRDVLDGLDESGEVFSVEDVASKLIFDIIGRIVFNTPLDAQTTGSPYLNELRELIALAHGQTDMAVQYNPVARARAWWKRRRVLSQLHPRILSKIQERLSVLQNENHVPSRKNPYSILDLMLREYLLEADQEGKVTERGQIRELTSADTETLLTNIKGLLLGGHGTTADTLCFALMLLSNAPDAMEKLRREHQDVLGKDLNTTVASLLEAPTKLQELPYTEAVIKETLRLFPVGFGVREAEDGKRLSHRGESWPIDQHMAVVLNGHDVHYNAEFFPQPERFVPERWMDAENEIPRSYFRTFGRGLRGCLGVNLAQNELKVILVMIARDYDFACHDIKPNAKPRVSHTNLDTIFGDMVFQELGLEARPRGGMMMTVRRAHN